MFRRENTSSSANGLKPYRSSSGGGWFIKCSEGFTFNGVVGLLMVLVVALLQCSGATRGLSVPPLMLTNSGFEDIDASNLFARGWIRGFGKGTNATAELDTIVKHSGSKSLRITDSTPSEAYKYALVNSDWLAVRPDTTYDIHFWARGRKVGKCFIGVHFRGAGEDRQSIPTGDFDWREIKYRITTPAASALNQAGASQAGASQTNMSQATASNAISIQFIADGLTEALWIDDVRIEVSPVQLANIAEAHYSRDFSTWFPRTRGAIPKRLFVVDISRESSDVTSYMTALQGIVNREAPQLYLLNPTNPAGYDSIWLRYMNDKGYTNEPQLLDTPADAIRHFRKDIQGVIIWDPDLPGSVNAAWMLAGLKDSLPVSPETAKRLGLPIVEDLRGRWKRNVEAYRYIYQHYWPSMNHWALAWEYPLTSALTSRDYMVQHRIFMFWVSGYLDNEKGADPPAEREFLEELLSKTPANLPVMGWPAYDGPGVSRGMEEYTAVRLLSEYGKWVPGTGFSSNVSVLSAIRPADSVFHDPPKGKHAPVLKLKNDKIYLTLNILDSGDAHWYWQFYQRKIWADKLRGSMPIGYGMNVTLMDTLPLVAQWYYENRTPNDSFFALIYMNAPIYASRFRKSDRERIWKEYVSQLDSYRRQMGMQGIEIYNGGSGGPTASDELLRRFTKGMPGLKFILADLGRHTDVHHDNANKVLDGVAIFHTLTNFRVWSKTEEVQQRTMEGENNWLLGEILANSPKTQPGFMSGMAISWNYYPSWLKDLESKLPPNYIVVSPLDLTRLYLENSKK